MAMTTASQAICVSRPAIGSPAPSTATITSDSISPVRPRPARTVPVDEPLAAFVGDAEHRRGQLLHRRPVDERAPYVGAELDVHAGLVGGGQRWICLHDPLEHRRAVADGGVHALAEAERHV